MLRTSEDFAEEKAYLHAQILSSRKIIKQAHDAMTDDNEEVGYYLIESEKKNIANYMQRLYDLAVKKKEFDEKN